MIKTLIVVITDENKNCSGKWWKWYKQWHMNKVSIALGKWWKWSQQWYMIQIVMAVVRDENSNNCDEW